MEIFFINYLACLTRFNLGFRYVHDLNNLVNRYNSVMDSLTDTKFIMLDLKIGAIRTEMNFGCKRLNWTCLGMVHTESETIFVCKTFYTSRAENCAVAFRYS